MIRDHIEGFELSDDILHKHGNETSAINYLFAGLEYLYQVVRQAERDSWQRFVAMDQPKEPEAAVPQTIPPGVRICAFHWYATTACNLVKMIGWIRQRHDSLAISPAGYVDKVLPEVKVWRDKVSAHFALHTPHRSDTPADELASLIPPTAQINGRFLAGAYQVHVRRAGQTSGSQLRPWSLTQVHEQLRARYGYTAEVPRPAIDPLMNANAQSDAE